MRAGIAPQRSVVRQPADRRARLNDEASLLARLASAVAEPVWKIRAKLDAVATLLPSFHTRADPSLIEPIAAWQGRFGKGVALRDALVEALKAAGGE